jgi:flavorubredoxin
MTSANPQSSTRIDEIAEGIYRINTPLTKLPGGFSYNQYLIVDDEPVLFHTGPTFLFPEVRGAVASVMPFQNLRWAAFSHHEQDESGALADVLAAAPRARALCSQVAALVGNAGEPEPRGMADGETLRTGKRTLRWVSAPHVPHGWDCGYLFDESSRTLFCGDLFTQPGLGELACTESDILGPSEAFRAKMDYYAHGKDSGRTLERIASTSPTLLACMHGSAWRGNGAALIRELSASLARTNR